MRNHIVRLYRKGREMKEIAATLGTSYSNVRYHLRDEPRRPRATKPVPERREIVRLYSEGYSPLAVAKKVNRSSDIVRRELQNLGFAPRPRGSYHRALCDDTEREIAELYLAGATVHEIGQAVGAVPSLVCKALDRQGIPRRTMAETRNLRGTWNRRGVAYGGHDRCTTTGCDL